MVEFAKSPPVDVLEICGVDHLWDGEMEHFRAGDTSILLLKINGRFHAYQARCPHQGAALVEGELDGALLTCAAHRWQFDATNGQGVNPRCARLRRYPVHVVDRKVLIEVGPGGVNPEQEPLCDRPFDAEDAHNGE
jgi:nitrite reductase/ring-hydroxylating ferredoxin subunit